MLNEVFGESGPIAPQTVTDQDFDREVLEAKVPVVVDFWAEWCGPCKAVAPLVDALAQRYQGKVKVAKIDIDENPESTTRFNVRSIPTLLIFKDGAVREAVVGLQPRVRLEELVERYL
jgi:thioredoxin 1